MRTQDSVNVIRMGNYGDLAREYYDSVRHPTCANFREASRRLLISWLSTLALSGAHLLEVGAGASIVSEWLSRNGRILDRFIVTDLSSKMLQYSHNHVIDQRIVCDAQKLPFIDGSFDVVVASLGDPYNTTPFWSEAVRVLRRGGYLLFTSPSFEWASQYRGMSDVAEFVLSDGTQVGVPSYVNSEKQQLGMMSACGLTVIETAGFKDSELSETPRSSKLRRGRIVDGYLVEKK